MYETSGRHSSSDTVGEELRDEMETIVSECDPFNMERAPVKHSSHRSTGSPFSSLTVERMEDFVASVKTKFAMLYVDVVHPGMGE